MRTRTLTTWMAMMLAIAAAGCSGQDNPAAPTALGSTPTEATAIAATATSGTPQGADRGGLQAADNGGQRSAVPQTDTARCQQIHGMLSTIVGSRQPGPSITDSRYIYRRGPANDQLRFGWGPPSWLTGHVIGYWHQVRRLQPGPAQSWGGWHWSTTVRTHAQDGLNEPSSWGPGDTPKYKLQVRMCHKTNGTVYVHRRKGSAGSIFTVP